MEEVLKRNSEEQEAGEAQLNELIKEAGDVVRSQNKKAKARHLERLREAVNEGVARRKNPITT